MGHSILEKMSSLYEFLMNFEVFLYGVSSIAVSLKAD
jgi:hypothetical protein